MIDINILQKAIVLTQQGNFDEAEKIYRELEKQNSDDVTLLSTFGLFYVSKRDFEKASYYLEKACSIEESFGVISALGYAKYEQKNYKDAAIVFERALSFGENADVYDKLISCLFQIKHYSKAISFTEIMYEKYPENQNSVVNKIKSLTQSGKLREAEVLCVENLKENNNNAALWLQLGYLKELIYSDDKQACECFKIVLELGHKEALYSIASSLYKQGDYKNAEIYYKKMLDIFPRSSDTKTGLGLLYLKQKRFKEGYEILFQAEKLPIQKFSKNHYNVGDDLESDVIVLCDQGFGDHIQYVRYLPILKTKVKKLQVCVHHSLRKLFEYNYPEIDFIAPSEVNPEIQSVKITDLPYILDMDFDNIPYKEGYLKSDLSNIVSEKQKIGLCWEAGNAGIRTMINRTINIKDLESIINLDKVQIFSLQVNDSFDGCERYPQIIDLANEFNDFSDTAKAIMAMDLVITVDTSVAHLAGALGKKTFLLLPYVTDWRWFEDDNTTAWYDSVQIFKQVNPISWKEPIENILKILI